MGTNEYINSTNVVENFICKTLKGIRDTYEMYLDTDRSETAQLLAVFSLSRDTGNRIQAYLCILVRILKDFFEREIHSCYTSHDSMKGLEYLMGINNIL